MARMLAAGFSDFPAKHFYQMMEEIPAPAAGTMIDTEGNNDVAFATAIATGGKWSIGLTPTNQGAFHVPTDDEDIVMIVGGIGNGAGGSVRYGNTTEAIKGIKVGDSNAGGIVVLGLIDSTPGVGIFSAVDAGLMFIIIDRSENSLKVYSVDADTDLVETGLAYESTGITGTWTTVIDSVALGSAQLGWAFCSFPDHSLPGSSQLMEDLNLVNKTWRKPNRLLPSGWSKYFSY